MYLNNSSLISRVNAHGKANLASAILLERSGVQRLIWGDVLFMWYVESVGAPLVLGGVFTMHVSCYKVRRNRPEVF